MSIVTRDLLHGLVDQLPDSEMATARRLLEALRLLGRDPRQLTLEMAAWDDESPTEEEAVGIAIAYDELARGEVFSGDEAKRRLLA